MVTRTIDLFCLLKNKHEVYQPLVRHPYSIFGSSLIFSPFSTGALFIYSHWSITLPTVLRFFHLFVIYRCIGPSRVRAPLSPWLIKYEAFFFSHWMVPEIESEFHTSCVFLGCSKWKRPCVVLAVRSVEGRFYVFFSC